MPVSPFVARNRGRYLVGLILVVFLTGGAFGASDAPKKTFPAGTVDLEPLAGPTVRVQLKKGKLTLVTPYGTLLIPIADIQRIEFSTRVSADEARRIAAAITDLGSSQYRVRQAASTVLLRLAEKAYPALQKASKNADLEVHRRATELLHRLLEKLPDELPPVRPADVVYTKTSKIAGRLVGSELEGRSAKGTVRLHIADLRTLAAPEADDVDIAKALPDPGNLTGLPSQPGKTFLFKVTGRTTGGFVWGTDVYTTDSALALVVVHAGVLKAGQTGYVRVKMVAAPATYSGSTRHGVTSSPWGAYPAAFRVRK